VLRVYASGALLPTPALTLSSLCTASEQGLLGVAADPDFVTNNFIYIYYTLNKSGTCVNRRHLRGGGAAALGERVPSSLVAA
jgi:hypothetical protein